jgi:hypothetical protein
MERPAIQDHDRWMRVGKGRELQFFATDEEVQAWLVHALPPQYAPYHLVGADKVKQDRFFTEAPFECEIFSLINCMRGTEDVRYNFWIRSEVLTPKLPLTQGFGLTKLFSYNGLVLLQHGLMLRNLYEFGQPLKRAASRIAVVDKVRNLETGEGRHHQGYLEVYKALHRTISQALIYSSIVQDANGLEREDTRLQRMTQAAVHAYQAGFPFTNAPGRVLVGKRSK